MCPLLEIPDAPFECTCSPDCWCGRMTSRRWKMLVRLEPLGRAIPWRPKHKLDPARALDAQRLMEWKRQHDPERFQHGGDERVPAVVDVLYFDGCPNHEPALDTVRKVAADFAPTPLVRTIEIRDVKEAERRRFLGSPTIRVNGRDIEPGAADRANVGMSCRMFATSTGLAAVPEESWILEGLNAAEASGTNDEAVARALDNARISPDRCGHQRAGMLPNNHHVAYLDLIHMLSNGERPTRNDVAKVATANGLEADELVFALAEADLVHLDENALTAAYPFSGVPTRHEVTIAGRHKAFSMCAIDALGIAAMLGVDITIRSTDPLTDKAINVTVSRDSVMWNPNTAVVLVASKASGTVSCATCCSYTNFFATPQSALDYLAAHLELDGYPVSMPLATITGERIFGRVLTNAPTA